MPAVTYTFEIDAAEPPPPAVVAPNVRPIRQTYQAHKGCTSTHTAWVRGDAGKPDLSGLTLAAVVTPYGKRDPVVTLDATSTEAGRIDFTLTAEQAHKLQPGPYLVAIRADNGASVVLAHAGLLEIV